MICCLFFSCTSTQADKQMKTNLEIHIQRPCWLKTKPENCETFKNTKDNWIFLVDHIITRKQSEEMTEHKQRVLLNQLNAQYISKMESKIISEIKYYTECINEETKDQCNTLFQNKRKLISKGTIEANEIELIEIFWERTSTPGEWKLFGLGKFDKRRYLNKLNLVLKGKSLSPTQETDPIKPSEMQYVYSISSPSEMTDIFNIPAPKYIEDTEDIETCNDIQFKFTALPKRATLDDCINSIQQSLKKIYSQRRDGAYLDDRVLETNSECRKKGCTNEHDEVVVEDEMEKKYNKTVSCWHSRIKQIEAEYINKKKDALLQYRNTHHNVTRFNHILSEWSYEIDVQIKNDEEKKLIEDMYQQKKKLLNSYYLVFTIATSGHQPTNSSVIRKYAITLAKKELLNQATKYNILKNILLDNGELKYDNIHANYNIQIMPNHFSQLKIAPGHYIAKIMKFRVGVSSSSTKLLSDEERSKLLELKTKSFIIAGNEDIILDERLKPINHAQIIKRTYQNWREIALKNTVEEEKKNNIRNLINEVIVANIKAKKTVIRYQNEYFDEKKKLDEKIKHNQLTMQELNNELCLMLNIRNVLPATVTDHYHKKSILSDVRQRYLTYLLKEASQKERTIDGLNNVQPKIVQLLIDSSLDADEESFIDKALMKIETVFKDSQDNFCLEAFHSRIGIQHIKPSNDVFLREIINPVFVGYRLPVIKIKPEYVNEQARFSIPIMLQVRCESMQISFDSFKYSETYNVILDYSTNIQWKVLTNRFPMTRKNDNDDWDYPSLKSPSEIDQYLNNYRQFCIDYNNFYQEITNKYQYHNYPEIECIKRFMVDKNHQDCVIRDILRQEEWKLIENVNYNNLRASIRNSNWIMNTVESLSLFFNELKASFERDNVNHDIINMLSNKYFWTSSNFSTRTKLNIMLDFDTGQLKGIPEKKENSRTGIVTRKTGGF